MESAHELNQMYKMLSQPALHIKSAPSYPRALAGFVCSAISPQMFSSLVHFLLQMIANNKNQACPRFVDRSGFQLSEERDQLCFNLFGMLKDALLWVSYSGLTLLSQDVSQEALFAGCNQKTNYTALLVPG